MFAWQIESEKRETLEVAQLVERLMDNLASVQFWDSSEVEDNVKRLCMSHQRLQRKLEICRARLKSSESDLQKNRRALVRSLSEKRSAENKPKVVVRDSSGKVDKDSGSISGKSDGRESGTPSQSSAISLVSIHFVRGTLQRT